MKKIIKYELGFKPGEKGKIVIWIEGNSNPIPVILKNQTEFVAISSLLLTNQCEYDTVNNGFNLF